MDLIWWTLIALAVALVAAGGLVWVYSILLGLQHKADEKSRFRELR